MPELNINIPSIKQSFYDITQSKANKEAVEKFIRPTYGKIINNISFICNVPAKLIESFIFIESGGKNVQGTYATGLMQINPPTACDTLVREKGAGRLTDAEAQIIKKYIPTKWSLLENVKKGQTSLGSNLFITNADLLKPEFNILIGTILLKQLIDKFTQEDKIVRMDKVVTVYNAGLYASSSKAVMASKGTIEDIIKFVPKETSAYILKLVGQRGLLDTLA
jgi:soluble lytic murein transglycosylase-like protein